MEDKSVYFVVNPHSRAGKTGKNWDKMYTKIQQLIKYPSDFKIADGIGTGLEATTDAIKEGYTTIVGVGGEGTINECVNGIYNSNKKEITLGFIISGTVNDYQHLIEWPMVLEEQVKLINEGETIQTPLTKVNGDSTRLSLNLADTGVSALTAYMASIERKLLWIKGSFRYTLLALQAIKKWKNIPATINADGREINGNLSMMMAGFSKDTGSYRMLPHADTYGDKLAYTVAMDFSKFGMVSKLGMLKKGKHTEDIPGVYMGHASKIQIEAEKGLIFEVDGEPFSYDSTTISIEALPGYLNVINPKK
ncbi:MAG: diacylglycerol kinase family protein [Candidatus Heimdallarchaeota archaeon]|nr:diacylglycerol kinase family protein [Candidatus Heimdallarchaeota archaeon]MDH5644403.1 diacylglycerol kinase family protein [Candidatus Heimdallarchaeota archaeon]